MNAVMYGGGNIGRGFIGALLSQSGYRVTFIDVAEPVVKHLQEKGAKATPCDTIAEGVRLAVEKAGEDGVVLCFGSLYTIADIRAGLEAL